MFKRLTLVAAMIAFLSTTVFAQGTYKSSENSSSKTTVQKSKKTAKVAKKSTKKQHVASAKKKGKKPAKVVA